MNLEQAFKQASYKVWDELEPIASTVHKIHPVREEALTSMALKVLANANCKAITKVEMISSDKEKTDGYDFELLIGHGKKWIRLFIQSKRLYGNSTSDSYDAIKFDQVEKLINFSKKTVGIPTYAFYNHVTENDLVVCDYYNSITSFDRKSLGITLTSALTIKMLPTRKFADYHYNYGYHLIPRLQSVKSFEYLFYFYSEYRKHLSIPFHDLSYLTIDFAEEINKLYKKWQAKGYLPFFFFFFPGFEQLYGDDELIPIIRNQGLEVLVSDFRLRASENTASDFGFNPQALMVVDTEL
ncbi:MAG: DUF6615 family protein [Flavisolibacter sp.]